MLKSFLFCLDMGKSAEGHCVALCSCLRISKALNSHSLIVNQHIIVELSDNIRNGVLCILQLSKIWWCYCKLKARSHDPFLRIRFLVVPKIGSCEHIENDLPTHGSVVLKKRMEIKQAGYFHPTLFLKDERRRQILHDIPVIVLAPNWRFFVSSENRIVRTHCKWPSDILTTKTEPWNPTVWTPASNFRNQESDP